jgi:Tfp pilus assembly protein PilV
LASFILGTGILAVLNMQALALSTSQNNSHLLRAEWLLNDMLERMKANPFGFLTALQLLPEGKINAQCESAPGCSPEELAAHDLARWRQRLTASLPEGHGEIEATTIAGYSHSARVFRVTVRWQGSRGSGRATQMPDSSGIVVL